MKERKSDVAAGYPSVEQAGETIAEIPYLMAYNCRQLNIELAAEPKMPIADKDAI